MHFVFHTSLFMILLHIPFYVASNWLFHLTLISRCNIIIIIIIICVITQKVIKIWIYMKRACNLLFFVLLLCFKVVTLACDIFVSNWFLKSFRLPIFTRVPSISTRIASLTDGLLTAFSIWSNSAKSFCSSSSSSLSICRHPTWDLERC